MDNSKRTKKAVAFIISFILAIESPVSVIAAPQGYPRSEESHMSVESPDVEAGLTPGEEIQPDNAETTCAEDEGPTDGQTVSGNTTAVEITELRDESIKAYGMSDHSVRVCYYPEPVNYRNDEGEWETIDNRLHFSSPDNFSPYRGYRNNASGYRVQFAEEANEARLFTIGDGAGSLSFRYVRDGNKNKPLQTEAASGAATLVPDGKDGVKTSGIKSWSRRIRLESNEGSGEGNSILENYGDNGMGVSGNALPGTDDEIPPLPQPQTVWYEEIEEGASFRYDLMGEGVKESIVISSPTAPEEYIFDIASKNQTLELTDNGDVVCRADGAESFIIPSPVVTDAAGAKDSGAHYVVSKNADGSYRLTLCLTPDWLSDKSRSFPVDADPTIEIYRKYASMDALGEFVSVGSDDSIRKQNLYTGIDKVRNEKNALPEDKRVEIAVPDDEEEEDPQDTDTETPDNDAGIHYRTYMKFNLPEIPKGSVVTGAKLRLKSTKKSGDQQYYYAVYADTDRLKKKNRGLSGMKWSGQPIKPSGTISLSELDIIDYGNKGTDELDITAAVKGWSDGTREDDCLCLIMSNETSADIGKKKKKGKTTEEIKTGMRQIEPAKSKNKPFLTIEYKDFTGTEDYWGSHTQTAGNAGTSAINDFTGRLTFVHQDAASAGERMPLSLSHVYDVAFGERADDLKWQTAEKGGAFGLHWRLSTDVRLLVPTGETKVEDYPYVYIDPDGTKHYFKNQKVVYYANGIKQTAQKKDDEHPAAADEDGLGLFVVPVKDEKIKDEYPLKIVDKSSSTSMYFDKYGYLGMVADSNQREDGKNAEKKERNAIRFEHEDAGYNPGYDGEKARAETEELKAIAVSIKETAGDVGGSIEKAKEAMIRIKTLQEKALVFSVSYKAAHALDLARGYMQDIVDNTDIKKDKVKELSGKAEKELAKILDEKSGTDFDIHPRRTTSVTDAAGKKAVLSYDGDGHLVSMTDPSEDDESITYSYDDGRLTEILHPCGIRATYVYWATDCLSGVMDECGSALIYNYDSQKRISRVTEYAFKTANGSGKKLKKTMKNLSDEVARTHKNPGRKGNRKTTGQTIYVSYDNYNETAYRFSGKDDQPGSKDDIENIYCFDNKGRTVNVYTRNAQTKRVSDGQACTYADKADEGDDAVNKIKDSAVLGSQVVNYVADSGFEKKKKDDARWRSYAGTNTADISTKEKYLGKKSAHLKLKASTNQDGMPYFEQEVKVPFTGIYTASVYVKTKDFSNAHVVMSAASKKVAVASGSDGEAEAGDLTDEKGDGAEDDPDEPEEDDEEDNGEPDEDSTATDSETLKYDATTPSEIDDGWKRLEARIKVSKGQAVTIRLGLYGDGGEAFFDCVQVEKNYLANKYNLLPNSGFEGNYASGKRANLIPEGWAYTNSQGEVDAALVTNEDLGSDSKVIEGKKALCIQGKEDEKKVLVINPNFGTGNASYTFSCYVKADCAPARGKRKVGIYIQGDMPEFDESLDPDLVEYIKKNINKDDIAPAAYAEINTSVRGWQYVSMALPGRNWNGKLVEIHFDYECGSLCVDACMLTRDGVDVRTYSSTGKLLTSKGKEKVTKYATDERDRTKKTITPGGAKKELKYDKETNDLLKETNTFSQPGNKVSKTSYTYNEFGNVIQTEITWDNGKKLVTDSEYDSDGRFATSSKDSRGGEITYDYDVANGTLKSVTDAEGKATTYEYDAYLNPTRVVLSGAGGETAGSVGFAYDDVKHSQLRKISLTDELGYAFGYDAFGNVTFIGKGNKSLTEKNYKKLAKYSYNSFNGKLNSIEYGNGDKATLKYNDLELISERNFGSKDRLRYEYDSKGRLSRIHDDKTSLTYSITYDAAERVTHASIFDRSNNKDVVEFSSHYDKAGRQSAFAYYYDKKAFRSEYGYTSDDKVSAVTLPTGGYLRRIYDSIGRTCTETFIPHMKKATGEKKKTSTTGAEVKTTLNYLGTDREGHDGIDSGKDYTYTTKLLTGLTTTVTKGKENIVAVSDTLSYDKVGRVSRYNAIDYEYDVLGRLTKAADTSTGDSWEYEYDDLGNITQATSVVGGKKCTETWSYDEKKAKDELTSYSLDGVEQKVKIENGGNPKNYRGYAMAWQRGGELRSIDGKDRKGEKLKAEYTYSYEGIRLKKVINGETTEYIVNGSTILAQKTVKGDKQETLNFYYSPEGKLLEIGYSEGKIDKEGLIGIGPERHYTVIRNAFGDVTALYTADGTLVGSYSYDPYGKLIPANKNEEHADPDGILEKNPFRYRGYYYDSETGWYYLNSRYYDPEVKRFINADSTEVLTNQCVNLMQYNLFAYCNDNPVNKSDDGGNLENWQKVAIGIGVIAAVGIVTVATAGTGTALACFAAGAFEGAVTGAATGAVMGAATGAVSSRIKTGSWDGVEQAAIDGAASGFMTGAITGAITGGITSNHCFVEGTLVLMEDGYKPIEAVMAGDFVYAANEETGEVSVKEVVQTFVNETDELVHLHIGSNELVTTPGHPFFIYGRGFEYAGNLRAGDILVSVNGDKVILELVQHEILESPAKVYNFEVQDWHTYFVGNDEVWVHNMCTPDTSADDIAKSTTDNVSNVSRRQAFRQAKEAFGGYMR